MTLIVEKMAQKQQRNSSLFCRRANKKHLCRNCNVSWWKVIANSSDISFRLAPKRFHSHCCCVVCTYYYCMEIHKHLFICHTCAASTRFTSSSFACTSAKHKFQLKACSLNLPVHTTLCHITFVAFIVFFFFCFCLCCTPVCPLVSVWNFRKNYFPSKFKVHTWLWKWNRITCVCCC